MRFRFTAAIAVAALLSFACGGVTDPSKNTIEQFSGTVPVAGVSQVKTFNVSNTGEITMILTSLTPFTNVALGVIFAQASSTGCDVLLQQNPFAFLNSTAISTSIIKGSYCVYLYDANGLTAPENFTLSISHP